MSVNELAPFLFGAVMLAILGNMAWGFLKHGGFKGMLFGARVLRTVGEVQGAGRPMMKNALKVYVLDGSPEKTVGLEFVVRSLGSYHTMPFSMSASEAQQLVAHLQAALNAS